MLVTRRWISNMLEADIVVHYNDYDSINGLFTGNNSIVVA